MTWAHAVAPSVDSSNSILGLLFIHPDRLQIHFSEFGGKPFSQKSRRYTPKEFKFLIPGHKMRKDGLENLIVTSQIESKRKTAYNILDELE